MFISRMATIGIIATFYLTCGSVSYGNQILELFQNQSGEATKGIIVRMYNNSEVSDLTDKDLCFYWRSKQRDVEEFIEKQWKINLDQLVFENTKELSQFLTQIEPSVFQLNVNFIRNLIPGFEVGSNMKTALAHQENIVDLYMLKTGFDAIMTMPDTVSWESIGSTALFDYFLLRWIFDRATEHQIDRDHVSEFAREVIHHTFSLVGHLPPHPKLYLGPVEKVNIPDEVLHEISPITQATIPASFTSQGEFLGFLSDRLRAHLEVTWMLGREEEIDMLVDEFAKNYSLGQMK